MYRISDDRMRFQERKRDPETIRRLYIKVCSEVLVHFAARARWTPKGRQRDASHAAIHLSFVDIVEVFVKEKNFIRKKYSRIIRVNHSS